MSITVHGHQGACLQEHVRRLPSVLCVSTVAFNILNESMPYHRKKEQFIPFIILMPPKACVIAKLESSQMESFGRAEHCAVMGSYHWTTPRR